ncbi:MAG: hypothetical protein RRB13_00065 [bacterium]|nr:hypothetical protein [bacterium]
MKHYLLFWFSLGWAFLILLGLHFNEDRIRWELSKQNLSAIQPSVNPTKPDLHFPLFSNLQTQDNQDQGVHSLSFSDHRWIDGVAFLKRSGKSFNLPWPHKDTDNLQLGESLVFSVAPDFVGQGTLNILEASSKSGSKLEVFADSGGATYWLKIQGTTYFLPLQPSLGRAMNVAIVLDYAKSQLRIYQDAHLMSTETVSVAKKTYDSIRLPPNQGNSQIAIADIMIFERALKGPEVESLDEWQRSKSISFNRWFLVAKGVLILLWLYLFISRLGFSSFWQWGQAIGSKRIAIDLMLLSVFLSTWIWPVPWALVVNKSEPDLPQTQKERLVFFLGLTKPWLKGDTALEQDWPQLEKQLTYQGGGLKLSVPKTLDENLVLPVPSKLTRQSRGAETYAMLLWVENKPIAEAFAGVWRIIGEGKRRLGVFIDAKQTSPHINGPNGGYSFKSVVELNPGRTQSLIVVHSVEQGFIDIYLDARLFKHVEFDKGEALGKATHQLIGHDLSNHHDAEIALSQLAVWEGTFSAKEIRALHHELLGNEQSFLPLLRWLLFVVVLLHLGSTPLVRRSAGKLASLLVKYSFLSFNWLLESAAGPKETEESKVLSIRSYAWLIPINLLIALILFTQISPIRPIPGDEVYFSQQIETVAKCLQHDFPCFPTTNIASEYSKPFFIWAASLVHYFIGVKYQLNALESLVLFGFISMALGAAVLQRHLNIFCKSERWGVLAGLVLYWTSISVWSAQIWWGYSHFIGLLVILSIDFALRWLLSEQRAQPKSRSLVYRRFGYLVSLSSLAVLSFYSHLSAVPFILVIFGLVGLFMSANSWQKSISDSTFKGFVLGMRGLLWGPGLLLMTGFGIAVLAWVLPSGEGYLQAYQTNMLKNTDATIWGRTHVPFWFYLTLPLYYLWTEWATMLVAIISVIGWLVWRPLKPRTSWVDRGLPLFYGSFFLISLVGLSLAPSTKLLRNVYPIHFGLLFLTGAALISVGSWTRSKQPKLQRATLSLLGLLVLAGWAHFYVAIQCSLDMRLGLYRFLDEKFYHTTRGTDAQLYTDASAVWKKNLPSWKDYFYTTVGKERTEALDSYQAVRGEIKNGDYFLTQIPHLLSEDVHWRLAGIKEIDGCQYSVSDFFAQEYTSIIFLMRHFALCPTLVELQMLAYWTPPEAAKLYLYYWDSDAVQIEP